MVTRNLAKRAGTVRDRLASYEVVLLISGIWFLVQGLRYLFPPLFDTFQTTYGVSNTETGLLFTALLIGYSIVQFPAGTLADRVSEAKMIAGGAAGFAVAALIAASAPTFPTLAGSAVLIGLTTGIHKTVAIPYLSRTYAERKGFAIGVMDTIGQFGGAAAPLFIAVILVSALPWNVAFLTGAAVSAAFAGLFYVRVVRREAPVGIVDDDGDDDVQGVEDDDVQGVEDDEGVDVEDDEDVSYREIFFNTKFLLFVLIVMAYTFAWNGFTSFLPLFLIDAKPLADETASLVYSLLFVASLTQTATGWISDRLSQVNIMLSLLSVIVVGLTLILFVDGVWALGGITLLIGIGFHGFRPVRDAHLMELIPESIRGGTFGIVRTLMTAVGAIGPAAVGYISDVSGYIAAFSFLSAVLAGSVVLIIVMRSA
ncbi:Sugar phosphate permease [Halopenitus malekzadehii]|uniref:Sugar phosphate permease n=1 Tax=Halopenitus malekzadehii TaxID=1267564 RepID=A0A1H6IR04_9EURY|nr:MFS transporter [Halopenitus malekzadehii]SEH49978.1 Sugar phosphate permease [Halopenitus malekzadehii]